MKLEDKVTAIYKYFSQKKYMDRFIESGEVYFNSLSYFLSCEDKSRRDEEEDACIYRPTSGLVVTNLTTKKIFTLPGQLNSKVKSSDRIFVFCASRDLSKTLFQKFHAQACIEISDVREFERRLRAKVGQAISLEKNQFLAGPVKYVDLSDEPGTRHACPDQIIMTKAIDYMEENEFRFAFSLDVALFDANNVDYSLSPRSLLAAAVTATQIFQIGSLKDICNVVNP